MLLLSLVLGILICFGLPLGGMLWLIRRKKGCGKAFWLGAAAFTVSQLLIRIPILQLVLPGFTWYILLQLDPWKYGLFLGVTAGLAEESARWIGTGLFLKKYRERDHGIAFGLGHGGVEAMLLVGPNMAAGLAMVMTGQAALLPADAGSVLTAGVERISAMAFHVGASLLILYGVRAGKAFRYWLGAVALHTLLDAPVVILPGVWGVGIAGVELWAAAVGGGTLALGLLAFGKRTREGMPSVRPQNGVQRTKEAPGKKSDEDK